MNENDSSQLGKLDLLTEEFAQRIRNGETPSIEEYVQQHPELADDIRDLFPPLLEMEQVHLDEPGECDVHADLELTAIGDYSILSRIGRGGMGVVYEAIQESLGRRVALKVLNHSPSGSNTAAQRFRREARAAAKLHHTNIVPVFEVGQENDTYFYAMQYIRGRGLDEVIRELMSIRAAGSASTSPDRRDMTNDHQPRVRASFQVDQPSVSNLSHALIEGGFGNKPVVEVATPHRSAEDATTTQAETKTRTFTGTDETSVVLPGSPDLSAADSNKSHYFQSVSHIGLQVANGLSYAHQRDVIHRDIKPSNLLLDESGVVWITDFGLAKTEEEALTRTGDILGTIRYMSPERFKGHCDHRADIYSLGLTLYEFLTLRPAFDASDRLQLIDTVNRHDPIRPRVIDPTIPRDLETIVLKSIEKDPRLRYQSADAMADDLRRFVNDEPIKARRSSSLERLNRWGRRNPSIATLLGLLVAVFIVSFVVLFAQWRQTEKLRQLAEHRRVNAETSLRTSIEQGRLAQERLAEVEVQERLASDRFKSALATVETYLVAVDQNTSTHDSTQHEIRHDLLRYALRSYEGLLNDNRGVSQISRERARIELRIAQLQQMVGDPGARPVVEIAKDFERPLASLTAEIEKNPDDSQLIHDLAMCYTGTGDNAKAIELLEKVQTLGSNLKYYYRPLLSAYLDHARELLKDPDNADQAVDIFTKALTLQQKATRAGIGSSKLRYNLSRTLSEMGVLLDKKKRYSEASRMMRIASMQAHLAHQENPASYLLANNVANLALIEGRYLLSRHREPTAIEAFRMGVQAFQQMAAADPKARFVQVRMMQSLDSLMSALCLEREFEDAHRQLRQIETTLETLEIRTPSDMYARALFAAVAAKSMATMKDDDGLEFWNLETLDRLQDAFDRGFFNEGNLRHDQRIFSQVANHDDFTYLKEKMRAARLALQSQPATEDQSQEEVEKLADTAILDQALAVLKVGLEDYSAANDLFETSVSTLRSLASTSESESVRKSYVESLHAKLVFDQSQDELVKVDIGMTNLLTSLENLHGSHQLHAGERKAWASNLMTILRYYMTKGLWEKCHTIVSLACQLDNRHGYNLVYRGYFESLLDRDEDSQGTVSESLDILDDSKRPAMNERIVRYCLLAGDLSETEFERLDRLIQRGLERDKDGVFMKFHQLAYAMLCYRTGRFKEGLEYAKSSRARGETPPSFAITVTCVEAILLEKTGAHDAAMSSIDHAHRHLRRIRSPIGTLSAFSHTFRVGLEVIPAQEWYIEARKLIGGPPIPNQELEAAERKAHLDSISSNTTDSNG